MNILAFETASCHASLALLRSDDALYQKTLSGTQNNHSTQILPLLKQLLVEADTPMQTIDGFAFGSGPGAFTGVRLACALAQGFAVGLNKPILPVCSLAALAFDVDSSQLAHDETARILVAVDARMGEIYCAFYALHRQDNAFSPTLETLIAPQCIAPQALTLPDQRGWLGAGSAFTVYGDALAEVQAQLLHCEPQRVASASAVAYLARTELQQGRVPSLESAQPLYVRNKVAQTTAERLAAGGRA